MIDAALPESVTLLGKLAARSGFVTIAGRTFSLESLGAIVAAHEPGGQVRVLMPADVARAHGLAQAAEHGRTD